MTGKISKQTVMVLGIVVVAVVAAGLLVFLPQGRKLKHLDQRMTAQTQRLEADASLAAIVPALLREIEESKRHYKDFDRRLPEQKELGGFLRDIASHLTACNLSNQLIEPGNPTRSELFHTLPIIMRFRGSYLDIAKFLRELEQMERLARVERLSIVNDPDTPELEAELQINIYFIES